MNVCIYDMCFGADFQNYILNQPVCQGLSKCTEIFTKFLNNKQFQQRMECLSTVVMECVKAKINYSSVPGLFSFQNVFSVVAGGSYHRPGCKVLILLTGLTDFNQKLSQNQLLAQLCLFLLDLFESRIVLSLIFTYTSPPAARDISP